jgi:hypothetical protein
VGIREHVLFSWMVVLGVLFQNALFCAAVFFASDVNPAVNQVFRFAIFQILWAVITAPLFWVCFQYLFLFAEGVFGKSAANGQ